MWRGATPESPSASGWRAGCPSAPPTPRTGTSPRPARTALKTPPVKVVGAGEPLNPEVIDQVRKSWGVTIRDGFGQTESSVQIANTPGQKVKPGSMGRALPGFTVALLDPVSGERAKEGE